jgi:hypothetical protein
MRRAVAESPPGPGTRPSTSPGTFSSRSRQSAVVPKQELRRFPIPACTALSRLLVDGLVSKLVSFRPRAASPARSHGRRRGGYPDGDRLWPPMRRRSVALDRCMVATSSLDLHLEPD